MKNGQLSYRESSLKINEKVSMEQNHRRSVWIDLAKAIAIIGVMVDHTATLLYADKNIQYVSFFSVGLFLIVMGVTSSWSLLKGKCWNLRDRCWRIGGPYLMATFVYCILMRGVFDFETYLSCVVRFNSSGPLYYVMMYLQFLVVVPILSLFTRYSGWRGIILEITGLVVCMAIAWFTTNYTNVLRILWGGGRLLGGTFLVCCYVGVWFGKYCRNTCLGVLSSTALFLIFCMATMDWWYFIVIHPNGQTLDSYFPYRTRLNPPRVSLLVYSCLVAGMVFSLGALLDRCLSNRASWILRGVTYLGRHTLYIFLYHAFWLEILKRIPCISGMGYTWQKWVIYFSVMILGSLLFEVVFKWLYHVVVMAYRPRQAPVEEGN